MKLEKRNNLKKECVKKLEAINKLERYESANAMLKKALSGCDFIIEIDGERGILSQEGVNKIAPIMIERNKKKIAELNKELEDKPNEFATGSIVSLVDYVVEILKYQPSSEERMSLINKLINDLNNHKIKNPSKELQILQYFNHRKLLRKILLQAHSISFCSRLIAYIGNWNCLNGGSKFWLEVEKRYQKWYSESFKD